MRTSIRSVFVEMDVTLSGPTQFIVEWGRSNRTQAALAEVPVRNTWVQVNDTKYPLSTNVWEPRVYAVFTPQWYGDSVIKTKLIPSGSSSDFAFYDNVLAGYTNTMTDPTRVPYLTTYDNWLFDRAMTIYQVAFKTGNFNYIREAHRAAQFYANHINASGYFDMRPGGSDIKYIYGESISADYWLTGDDQLIGVNQRMLPNYADNFYNPSSTTFWTERNSGYKLLGYVTAFELLGNVSAQDAAHPGETVSQRARGVFDTLVSRQTNSSPNLGCIMHSRDSHEQDGRPEMIASPWMSTLMIDAIERYYIHSGDSRVSNFVKRYADCMDLSTNLMYHTSTTDYTRNLNLPYYLGPYTTAVAVANDFLDPYTDIEHALDVSKIPALAYYFTRLEGNPNAHYLANIQDLQTASKVEFIDNGPTYSLGTVRRYNWWFRTTMNNDWLVGGVVGTQPVPSPSPSPTPAPSSFTVTPSVSGTGGTISPANTVTLSSTASQTFTITPNSGFTISNVSVNGNFCRYTIAIHIL
jgi:hypothetical protein